MSVRYAPTATLKANEHRFAFVPQACILVNWGRHSFGNTGIGENAMSSVAATAPRFAGRLVVIVSLAMSLHSTGAFALGTDDQRAACTPDVFRLCGSDIPNVDRIVACLKKEKPNLSKDCKAVFNARPTRAGMAGFALIRKNRWCRFGAGVQDSVQQNWVTWCGPAARQHR